MYNFHIGRIKYKCNFHIVGSKCDSISLKQVTKSLTKRGFSSHSVTEDVSLVETARAAEFFLSDGVILTGSSTGRPADGNELKELKENVKLPVIIGSGITRSNLIEYLEADALIVGSHFKREGLWFNDLDPVKMRRFMEFFREQKLVSLNKN